MMQVPLGETASTSVFLVKCPGPPARLLRLKTWHRPAPAGFLERFHHLQAEIDSWAADGIDRLLAVRIDAAGRPSVLTEFRQGLPILDRVESGRLGRDRAIACLKPLIELTSAAHARGLVHGSIGPGNIIVNADSGTARLLDFGLTPLMSMPQNGAALAAADLGGFVTLARALKTLQINSDPVADL